MVLGAETAPADLGKMLIAAGWPDATPFAITWDGTTTEQQTVVTTLGRLAGRHQAVLVMREVQGLSYADIAQQLGVTLAAVETLLFRARRTFRREYGRVAGSLASAA